MPLRVEPIEGASFDPRKHGLKGKAFTFLFFFDFNSFYQRKNPFGVLEAFAKAFPQGAGDDVRILVKSIGAKAHPQAAHLLNDHVDLDSRIVHLDATLSATEMAGLIAYADTFVSLHRSEGFGRGMAEAMVAGRPVIATRYSGNLDFMTNENSYLVDYTMIPVAKNDYVMADGAQWADANLDHAAELMRNVFTDRKGAARRAALGQQTIRDNHSTETVARNLVARLASLGVVSG